MVFNKGDWVMVMGRFKWIGYITSISTALEEYEVRVIRKSNGEDYTHKNVNISVDFEDTKLMDDIELSEGDLYQLIDMALDTNDKEWFNELQSMLPKSEGVSL